MYDDKMIATETPAIVEKLQSFCCPYKEML